LLSRGMIAKLPAQITISDMTKSAPNPKVDWYFTKAKAWQEELLLLRTIALASGLTEELKWGHPCYTLAGANVFLMHTFKEYCALLFHKGALLKDPKGILVQQTAHVQSARQIRFTSAKEIVKMKAIIGAYIQEAISIEQAGLKVNLKKTEEFAIPEEFQHALDNNSRLETAFYELTPGRQRGNNPKLGKRE
jgi:uncharacterized protein YdeI (YjbR/CyaY-like superfamily)